MKREAIIKSLEQTKAELTKTNTLTRNGVAAITDALCYIVEDLITGEADQTEEEPEAKEILLRRSFAELTKIEDITEALAAGDIHDLLAAGDQIITNHKELGKVVFDVLDFDRETTVETTKHNMTLQMHSLLLPAMPFEEDDDKELCNRWEDSSLRAYLNSDEFIDGFAPEFRHLIAETWKKNDDREYTKDKFFLLSREEMETEGEQYELYKINPGTMCKQAADGKSYSHWTRSAHRINGCYTWYVYTSGNVNYDNAYYATRCAPACVIAR